LSLLNKFIFFSFIKTKKLIFFISIYQDILIILEMSYQSIEEYFNQFPDDVETIDVCFKTDHLPDLSRFYK